MSNSGEIKNYPICIVGAGFFGAVIAERVSREFDLPVLVVDRRGHIGGNCYSEVCPESGVEYHKYGSHIFHTKNKEVWDYVNRFSPFNNYRHRVLTTYRDRVFSMPINLYTINQFYGLNLSPEDARQFIQQEIAKERIDFPNNLEGKAISLIGRPLYEAFIKGYSEKQWETDLKNLPASIISRLPVRFVYDDRYFDDPYEGIPVAGYTGIFRKMLDHPKISVMLGTDFFELQRELSSDCLVIYTGPIDRFYSYSEGRLGWRTVRFDREVIGFPDFQGTTVMNYADREVPHTRIHEFQYFHPERKNTSGKTIIYREYSKFALNHEEDPYYPIATPEDLKRFEKYKQKMATEKNVIFGGRLATYKYLDMHQVIGSALQYFEKNVRPRFSKNAAEVHPNSL